MKVLFLTNNDISAPLLDWLGESENVIVLGEPVTVQLLQTIDPAIVVTYSYQTLLKADVLRYPVRFINLHISYLPFNRGSDPNAWSILEGTPKGVTIHLIDQGIDTGPILFQRRVDVEDTETLGGSYQHLHAEIQKLFKEKWQELSRNQLSGAAQTSRGTYHNSREFAALKERLLGDDGWSVTVGEFRARYAVLRASSNRMKLRAATMDDADVLLAWRNDADTKAMSHNKADVERKAHIEWLARSLANPNRRLLIAECDGGPVGTVRVDLRGGTYELSWTVAPQARGKGVATEMVAIVAAQIKEPISAQILRGNDASVRVALKAGMKFVQEAAGIQYFGR